MYRKDVMAGKTLALNHSLRSGSGHVPLESHPIRPTGVVVPCIRAERVVHGGGGGI